MNYFLGLASQYDAEDILMHTFAIGGEDDAAELRAYLAAHYGATFDHVALYHNGRSALTSAIQAVTHRGSKVVITALTCYAVVEAVKAAGCTPVFADIDKKTLHYGKKELETALDGETNVQAIIVQNNLGIPCDIEGIEEVANAHKLSIIEDLAHCTGVKYADGREVGTVGRAVALSFGKGKSIDTISGGAVIYTSPLDAPARQPYNKPLFRDRFRDRFYPLAGAIIRLFYRLNPKIGKGFTSVLVKTHAIQRSADAKLDVDTRLTNWQAKLALQQLKTLPHRGRPPIREHFLVENRERLLDELESHGFYFREIWYDTPVAPERYFEGSGFREEACPVATEVAKQIVNLPTHYEKSELAPAVALINQYLIEGEEKVQAKEEKIGEDLPKKVKKAEKAEKAEKPAPAAEKPAEKPTKKPVKTAPKAPRTPSKPLKTKKPSTTAVSAERTSGGMRVAPKKLSEREKLLEAKKRGENITKGGVL